MDDNQSTLESEEMDAVTYKKRYKWHQIPWGDHEQMIKLGIWVYFFLLIFEGALRKWFLPGLATPLLIIRDPVAFWIIIKAVQHRMFPSNTYITLMNIIGIVAILTTLTLGHGNIMVTLFGARILLLHFPLMFIIGRVFTREDVLKMMRVTLWIAVPMALLIALQFYSPQSAWVNRGVGGNMEGAGFSGSGEFFRPPGTFSFTTGNVQFFSMVAPFIFYFFLNAKKINKFLLLASFVALVISIPLSISRSLLLSVLITVLFTGIAAVRKTEYFSKLFSIGMVALVAIMILSQTSFFQVSLGAFTDRFELANESEGGAENVLIDRYFGGMITALTYTASEDQSFFGLGLGMGTNVGAMLLSGTGVFLISEDEWGRLIGEMGPLLGLAVIVMRLVIVLRMASGSYTQMKRGDLLPWILLSVAFMVILQGQWAQPTSVGFSTILGGLMISSLNKKI
jgi:hypothetical protein